MISVDLLPRRYRDAKAIEKFIGIAIIVIALCLIVVVSINLSYTVQTNLLKKETASLQQLASQYKTVNKRYEELKTAEASLTHRLELAKPLIAKDDSILPFLEYFRGHIPKRIWLTWLDLRLEGGVYIEGKALSYSDVASFIKWLEEERNLIVSLDKTGREEDAISFTLSAATSAEGGDLK